MLLMLMSLLVLFAANDPNAITTSGAVGWGAAIVAGSGVIAVLATYFTAVITGGKKMIDRIDELNTRQWKLQDELTVCKTELATCKVEHASGKTENVQLRAELERTQMRVAVLETNSGVTPIVSNVPGVIIADKTGTIIEFSPSLASWLGWTPEEMRGKNIESLVPSEHLEAHRAGFAKGAALGAVLDPTRRIFTFILNKLGKRVGATISVRKWPGPEGHMTATITQRESASVGPYPPGTPHRRASDA